MKFLRRALPVVLLALTSPAFAQSQTDRDFDALKSLAGTWQGTTATFPVTPAIQGSHVEVTVRVTAMGHGLLHEIRTTGRPDDPITMIYVSGDRLCLRQYADFGNRPLMIAKASPDANTLTFNVVEVSGSKQWGYMAQAVFTMIDSSHHIEDWTFRAPGNHRVRVHLDLHRVP